MEHSADEVLVEVGCAEDIENMMQLFFKERWEELFEDNYDRMEFKWQHLTGFLL